MSTIIVRIAGAEIVDADSFHDVMARALGFPAFYGRNLDALADCLFSVSEPDHGMVAPAIARSELVLLRLDGADLVRRHCPREYAALIEIVAFVNGERVKVGDRPALGLIPVDAPEA